MLNGETSSKQKSRSSSLFRISVAHDLTALISRNPETSARHMRHTILANMETGTDIAMRRTIGVLLLVSLALIGCGREPRASRTSERRESQTSPTQSIAEPRQTAEDPVAEDTTASSRSEAPAEPSITWPRKIAKRVASPNGRSQAIWDARGVYLTDSRGQQVVRLRIEGESGIANEYFDITLRYNRQGTRLAVLTTSSGGEPGICQTDRLYWTNVKWPRARLVAEWHECIQGNGVAVVNRELLGWSIDGKSILTRAEAWQGEGMPGAESVTNKTRRCVSFDVTRPSSWGRDRELLTSHLSWR